MGISFCVMVPASAFTNYRSVMDVSTVQEERMSWTVVGFPIFTQSSEGDLLGVGCWDKEFFVHPGCGDYF